MQLSLLVQLTMGNPLKFIEIVDIAYRKDKDYMNGCILYT